MNNPIITLKRGKEDSLNRFHPWVFSGAIASMADTIEEGDVVDVVSHDGRHIGVGHYQIGSIMVRILDFGATEINQAFFATRLADASESLLHADAKQLNSILQKDEEENGRNSGQHRDNQNGS